METLPNNPIMLASAVNTMLRDGEYDSLEELCGRFDLEAESLKAKLAEAGYEYMESVKQFR